METVWQIACGEVGRKYDDLFLDHDVMFCGPGRYGDYNQCKADYDRVVSSREFSGQKIGQVRSFANDVHPGHYVLLRSGHEVVGLGLVAEGGYSLNETFDDIYGWDLQHTQRIIWQDELKSELTEVQDTQGSLFANRKQIPTFTGVKDERVLDPIRHLFSRCQSRPLKPLPAPPSKPLEPDELDDALFSKGLSYDVVHKVRITTEKQLRMLQFYGQGGLSPGRPTEHEVVAHVILPLLLALGWSEQLLAVEWHKIDLAAFWGTPTDAVHCKLICEAKRWGHGLQNVLEQAKRYVEKRGLSQCDKILLADGARFYLYRKEDGEWCDQPRGYLNVKRIRERHVCPKDTNAVETIVSLTPAHVAR